MLKGIFIKLKQPFSILKHLETRAGVSHLDQKLSVSWKVPGSSSICSHLPTEYHPAWYPFPTVTFFIPEECESISAPDATVNGPSRDDVLWTLLLIHVVMEFWKSGLGGACWEVGSKEKNGGSFAHCYAILSHWRGAAGRPHSAGEEQAQT